MGAQILEEANKTVEVIPADKPLANAPPLPNPDPHKLPNDLYLPRSLPTTKFLNSVLCEDYQCAICQEVSLPRTAVEHKDCGRIYCTNCINDWIQKSDTCPYCRLGARGGLRGIKEDNKIAHRTLSRLIVRCIATGESLHQGCPWTGEFGALEDHLASCAFALVYCGYRCGKLFPRGTVKRHEDEDCGLRWVQCGFCKVQMRFVELTTHEDTCQGNPGRLRHCIYAKIGCEFRERGEAIKKHEAEADGVHLKLALKRIEALEKKENNWFG